MKIFKIILFATLAQATLALLLSFKDLSLLNYIDQLTIVSLIFLVIFGYVTLYEGGAYDLINYNVKKTIKYLLPNKKSDTTEDKKIESYEEFVEARQEKQTATPFLILLSALLSLAFVIVITVIIY